MRKGANRVIGPEKDLGFSLLGQVVGSGRADVKNIRCRTCDNVLGENDLQHTPEEQAALEKKNKEEKEKWEEFRKGWFPQSHYKG